MRCFWFVPTPVVLFYDYGIVFHLAMLDGRDVLSLLLFVSC